MREQMVSDEEYLILLGKRIKEIRERRGINKSELARRIGVNRITILRIEDGEVNSTINLLRQIATEFEMQIGQLVSL